MTDKEPIDKMIELSEDLGLYKEQIIIDGVDVSGCKFRNGDNSICFSDSYFCEGHLCYFKQLARKTQECEELKKQDYENLKIIHDDFNQIISLRAENARYREALKEIEKICLEDTYTFADGTTVRYDSLDDILNIINKAKENNEDRK